MELNNRTNLSCFELSIRLVLLEYLSGYCILEVTPSPGPYSVGSNEYIYCLHCSGALWKLLFITFLIFFPLIYSFESPLTRSVFSYALQEVEDEAKWKEASGRREEAVPGDGVHKNPRGGLWPERAGGAAQRDRPQRMARQQQWVIDYIKMGWERGESSWYT